MTVTDLLNRDLRIDWHEAVALVRDMLEALPEGAADSGNLPNFDQMDLMPTGQVRVSETLHTSDPVQQFGDMLLVLFGRGDPPVQLRLVASQHYDSVQAYSEALAFFERPDRMVTLRELYNRAVAALPLAVPDVFAGETDQATLERETTRPDPGRSGRLMVFAAGVAALIAIVAAGALYASRAGQAAGSEAGLSSQVSKGISGVGAKVGSAVAAIGDKVLGKAAAPVAAAPDKPAETQTVAAVKPQRPRRGSGADVRDIQGAKLTAFDLGAPPDEKSATVSTVPALPRSAGDKADDRQGADEDLTYSSTSSGVVPPVGVRPQLPKELPPGIRPADLTRIELVILPDGTVESVKLIGVPRTVHEAMLLSAVKAWEFHPAMKGGVPVKYRKTIWIAR